MAENEGPATVTHRLGGGMGGMFNAGHTSEKEPFKANDPPLVASGQRARGT